MKIDRSLAHIIMALAFPALGHCIDMGTIHSAETRIGSITKLTQVDTFEFTGTSGTGVIIILTRECSDNSFNPEVRLLDPANLPETEDSGFSTAEIENHQLASTGLYTIIVKERDENATCDYSLSLLFIPGPTTSAADTDGGSLLPGKSTTGAVTLGADTDAFTFSGLSGTGVIIVVTKQCADSSFNPAVRLYDPNGLRETQDSGFSTAEIENHQLASTGLYTIIVKERDENATCDYSLSLLLVPGPTISATDTDGGLIRSGEIRLGVIDPLADTDAYALIGQAMEAVNIIVTRDCSDNSFNPKLRLYDPLGLWEVGDSGFSTAEIESHQLQSTGLYTIVVTEREGDATCDYNLSLTKFPPGVVLACPAVATPVPNPSFPWQVMFSASVSGGSPPYTYQWSFGDSSQSTLQNPEHFYSEGGLFAWYLIVHDNEGQACVDHGLLNIDPGEIFSDGFESGDTGAWKQ